MSESLDLRVRRPRIALDLSILPTIRSLPQAIAKCAEMVGSIDKTVAIDTGIDAPTWARIKQGEAGIKGEFLDKLMDACGNELPLLWLLYSRGYDPASLRQRETELQQDLRREREAREAAEAELRTIKNFLRDTRAAG